MKRILLCIILTLMYVVDSYSQFTINDVKVNVIGLSDEYASRFKKESNVELFIDALNKLDIEYDISPILITVAYNDNQGIISTTIYDYNPMKHFEIQKYDSHNSEMKYMGGVGISLLFQEKIMLAITEYKYSVARDGWEIDNDIMNFANVVILSKSNGDLAFFSGYNYRQYNGAYPFRFYNNVELLINGKKYTKVKTDNIKALNDYSFFVWGKTTGINGAQTPAYVMSKFFEPTKADKIDFETYKKEKAENEARILAEKERAQEVLKNECLKSLLSQINSGRNTSIDLQKQYNCHYENDFLVCERDGVSVPIGELSKGYIGYTGDINDILTLIDYCDSNNTISISTINNNITSNNAELLSKLFDYKSNTVTLFDENKSTFFLDTQFNLKLDFNYSQRYSVDESSIKVRVQNKKDELIYKVSAKVGNSLLWKKLENETLLNYIKRNISEPGDYYFTQNRREGTISIVLVHNYNETLISGVYPCFEVSLHSYNKTKIKYYETGL